MGQLNATNMHEPVPSEFGVSEQMILEAEADKSWDVHNYVAASGALCGVLFVAFSMILSDLPLWAKVVFSIPAGAVMAMLGAVWSLPIGDVFSWLASRILPIFSSHYKKRLEVNRRIEEYRSAKSRYKALKEKELRAFWFSLDGWSFEHESARLFRSMGYQAVVTSGSGDKGIDLNLEDAEGNHIIVQCKQHNKPVGPAVIRELYGALIASGADQAILLSSSGFTSGVRLFAEGKPISLMSVDDLVDIQTKLNNSNAKPETGIAWDTDETITRKITR